MDGGGIIEAGPPSVIFSAPTQERTRGFLQAVLTRA
jgi:polar amino acid transport system ATP-binding protein